MTAEERRKKAIAALQAFHSAAHDMLAAWGDESGAAEIVEPILGEGYPSSLPSFDEFVHEVDAWVEAAEYAAMNLGAL